MPAGTNPFKRELLMPREDDLTRAREVLKNLKSMGQSAFDWTADNAILFLEEAIAFYQELSKLGARCDPEWLKIRKDIIMTLCEYGLQANARRKALGLNPSQPGTDDPDRPEAHQDKMAATSEAELARIAGRG